MTKTFTYDIHFNSETGSNNKGFSMTQPECEAYIAQYNGTNHSYFADYKGGQVSVVCNETSETVYTTEVK